MGWRVFLETYQLYRKWEPTEGTTLAVSAIPLPAINMECESCSGPRTFKAAYGWSANYSPKDTAVKGPPTQGSVLRLIYSCADCGVCRHFLVEFGPREKAQREVILSSEVGSRTVKESFQFSKWVRKVGQSPSWRPALGKTERRALNEATEAYEHALTCEGVSYGVGAFAYYRFVVDSLADRLKAAKCERLAGEDLASFETEWKAAERNGADRMSLVFDQLPVELREAGGNPLAYLYEKLSEGLHVGDDEACMKIVDDLRQLLLHVALGIQRDKDARASKADLRKLMQPRAVDPT